MKKVDLAGQRFGRLTVLRRDTGARLEGKHSNWICECLCGETRSIASNILKSGKRKSCGCAKAEPIKKDRLGMLVRQTYRNYKGKSKYRNITFELSEEEFRDIVTSPCHYCGEQDSKTIYGTDEEYQLCGIDRIDNSKHYLLENCVSCCKICNMAKGEQTLEQFYAWVDRVRGRR